jgi:hypothetical protein
MLYIKVGPPIAIYKVVEVTNSNIESKSSIDSNSNSIIIGTLYLPLY